MITLLRTITMASLLFGLQPTQVVAQVRAPLLSFAGDTEVTWVMVPANVIGQRGSLKILTREDFRLHVDGKPVQIDSLEASADATINLLIFQDLSGSMANGGKLAASRRALQYHLTKARQGDEMALVTFASDTIQVAVPATSELSLIAEHSAGWRAFGTTALHDAIGWIPRIHLAHGSTPAVILITDGIDNASLLDSEAARDLVLQAEIPVYVLALRGSRVDLQGPKGTRQRAQDTAAQNTARREPADKFLPYAKVLRRLAQSTGGRYFEVYYADDIDGACAVITRELRSRYTLGFQLSTQGEKTYHGLRITMPGRNLHLRHRAGYLGSAPH
jgi:VWFA-related protein